jgi:hypothetical protein
VFFFFIIIILGILTLYIIKDKINLVQSSWLHLLINAFLEDRTRIFTLEGI